ncbi:MAG: hypothetical protein IJO20_03465 [Ruminococcus sp.]|nr:hypothetical protein [Ruminococcus sp.]
MARNNRIYLNGTVTLRVMASVLVLLLAVTFSGCTKEDSTKDISYGATQNRASSEDLYCLEFTSYSGPYVEDGSNEEVENILAVLLENRSDEYLEFATVTYDVDGKTAQFVVSGLPPSKRAWVLEANRMGVKADLEFEFLDCQSTFRDDALLTTDKLEVEVDGNTLTLKNISEDNLSNPCVYYKNLNSDGNYLGGITYMVGFETLKPKDSLKKQAGHYTENSRIVRYSYQTY